MKSRATPSGGMGGQSPGSLSAHDTQRAELNSSFLPDSLAKERELFIQPFEFGSYCLLFGVLLAPAIFVCAAVFFYAALIA